MGEAEVPDPKVGQWYKDPNGASFEVVAVDEDDGTIEVQHFDGTVEEFEMDAWMDSNLEITAPPEDYSGSLDIERADYGLERDGTAPPDSDFLGYTDRAE